MRVRRASGAPLPLRQHLPRDRAMGHPTFGVIFHFPTQRKRVKRGGAHSSKATEAGERGCSLNDK